MRTEKNIAHAALGKCEMIALYWQIPRHRDRIFENFCEYGKNGPQFASGRSNIVGARHHDPRVQIVAVQIIAQPGIQDHLPGILRGVQEAEHPLAVPVG